jgi:Zn finger protein HypA/HybF involved in hydrogenase expression
VESLRFCVEVLAKGTELDGMNLDIEFRPRGSEMDITYLELEE